MTLNNLERLKANASPYPNASSLESRPRFFRLHNSKDENALSALLTDKPFIGVYDRITPQLEELVKTQNPSVRFDKKTLEDAVAKHLDSCPGWAYGVWVYYPWNEKLVHLLDEKEFIALRTNRNLYKITGEERDLLATKKIGVIGLSVGQSVSLTLAMERSFGELRIADFDSLDLSNLNRLRTGLHNLGLPKTVIVAREIAEIDPFLKVTCFHEGITENNIDDFIHKDGKLDVLIDECDSLDIKILCRKKARSAGIPVLMDTSDRGMIDIERFDLEPGKELFHGLLNEQNLTEEIINDPNQRIKLSLDIVGADTISSRLQQSIPEIGKSIATWPQLASSVAMGGGVIGEVSRKITLGENVPEGRYFIDVEAIISQSKNI